MAASDNVKLPEAEVESLTVDDNETVGLGETLADTEIELVRENNEVVLIEGTVETVSVVVKDTVGANEIVAKTDFDH